MLTSSSSNDLTCLLETSAYVAPDLAYNCLTSVPLHVEAAILLLNSLKGFLQLHTTTDYLRYPPTGYLWDAIDIPKTLSEIETKVKSEKYNSEYDFQLDVTALINHCHDGHLPFTGDLVGAITFIRSWTNTSLVSLSSDGIQTPEVYIWSDVLYLDKNDNYNFDDPKISGVSPLKAINNISVQDFLQVQSLIAAPQDPDALYNGLMLNPATDSYFTPSPSGSTWINPLFYPGLETKIDFVNGTSRTWKNLALIGPNLTGIVTGEDMYQLVCTYPTSSDSEDDDSSEAEVEADADASDPPAPVTQLKSYPPPYILDPSGAVSGYFPQDSKYTDLAVLVIRTFESDTYPNFQRDVQQTVANFLQAAHGSGKTKLVLDMQGNGGGFTRLGWDLLAQLFPDELPISKHTYRASLGMELVADAYGKHVEEETDADPSTHLDQMEQLARVTGQTFAYQGFLTPDGKAFQNFSDFYGPQTLGHGSYTSFFQWNLSDNGAAVVNSKWMNITGTDDRPKTKQPFDPKNMVVLTDG